MLTCLKVVKKRRYIRFRVFSIEDNYLGIGAAFFLNIHLIKMHKTNKNNCLVSPVLLPQLNAAALIISIARLKNQIFNSNLQFENCVIAFAK